MSRDLDRERRLPEPYRTAVRKFAESARFAKHDILYATAEELVAHGGVLPDGYTDKQFFTGLQEGIDEARARAMRLRGSERADRTLQARLRPGVEVDSYDPRPSHYRGKWVWLFHGTSSKLLRSMSEHGLVGDLRRTDPRGSLTRKVYLTASPYEEPCGAGAYAKVAAYVHGGRPLVVRVLVPFDALEPDPDDADLGCGRKQWIVDEVTREHLFQMDGQPLFKAKTS